VRTPAVYDALMARGGRTWDLGYYAGLTGRWPGAVLELGTGTGRLFCALLAAGRDVYGIDNCRPMLDAARAKALERFGREAARRLSLADARQMSLERQFGSILAPYNLLALVPRGDLPALLGRVAAHLSPEGRFAFDLFVADHMPWSDPPYTWHEEQRLSVDGESTEYRADGRFDPVSRSHTIHERVVFPSGRLVEERLHLYQWDTGELEAALRRDGWRFEGEPVDEEGRPFGRTARTYCAVVRRDVRS
jgi:SAM-dependent methyltransferase